MLRIDVTEKRALLSGCRKYAHDYKEAELQHLRTCRNAFMMSHPFLKWDEDNLDFYNLQGSLCLYAGPDQLISQDAQPAL